MRKKRISKIKSPDVTPLAVTLFRRAAALKPVYDRCVRGGRCKSASVGTHCSECLEYFQAGKALATELGIGWICDTSPLDVTSETPPDYICRNDAPGYRRAWQLRRALLAAVAAEREAG